MKKRTTNNRTNEIYKTNVTNIIQGLVNDSLYTSVLDYAPTIRSMMPEMYDDFVEDFIATCHMHVESSIRKQKDNGTISEYTIDISMDGSGIDDVKLKCEVDCALPTRDKISILRVKRLKTSVEML